MRRTKKPSVLMVDDVPANLIALEAQLSDLDCELVSARSGNDALRLLLRGEFALILLDVQMPGMDGYEVARYAREHPSTRDVPIIFLTAEHDTEASALRGFGSGAVDLMFKPLNTEIVRSKVQVFLDLHVSRRRLADEVEAHQRTLAELEALNHSIAHDLRAPLGPLEGSSQALLEDHGDRLDDEGRQHLTRIRAAAQRMSQLIDDLVRLSSVGRAEVVPQRVDLAELARAVIAELRAESPERTVTLVAPDVIAEGDAALLRIALDHLLRNAWKFTSKSPTSTIELGTRTSGNETVYFVRDDGIGFDATSAKRLFQPFQRFHGSDELEGTGIGLAITARVMRHHDGRIWAESAPGKGATFFFTLGPS